MLPSRITTCRGPLFRTGPVFLSVVLLALTLGSVPSVSAAQPKDDAPVPTEADREKIARERARKAVESRLERLRAEEARLEATLAAIDAGQPLSELRLPEPNPRERQGTRPDGDRGDDRDRDQSSADESFTDEEIRAFIAEVYPEWIERLEELQKRDPDAYSRMLQERRPRLVELMVERRYHPGIFEVRQKIARSEMQIRRAAWSYARADEDTEKQQAEETLTRILVEQFELRLELYRAELTEAEAEAQQIRERLDEASANRDQLLADRKADLLRAINDRRPPQSPRDGRPGRGGDRPQRR